MSATALVAAAVLSWTALALAGWSAVDLGETSRLGLCLLPWVALSGLPRGSRPREDEPGAVAALGVVIGLAVPALAVGARLDWLRGADALRVSHLALDGLWQCLLLALAARLARGRAPHALVWLVLVPGLPLLRAALGWASRVGSGDLPLVAGLAGFSPLSWALAWTAEPGPRHLSSWRAAIAVGLCLVAAFAGLRAGRPAGAGREERVA